MRQIIDYRTANDTGEIDAPSIAPINDGEAARQTVFRRPTENNRVRLETLRTQLRHRILLDDTFPMMITGGGSITFNGAKEGLDPGTFTISADLHLYPLATGGGGGSEPYIQSTTSGLLIGTAGVDQMGFLSKKNQFEGTDALLADANRISIEIVHGDALAVEVEGATGDENNIKITVVSGTTTIEEVVAEIAATPEAAALVTALSGDAPPEATVPLWGPAQWGTDYAARYLAGGSAGIVHTITAANLADFFGIGANGLRKGDTLAIWYEHFVSPTGSVGGRFQSTPENSNTTIPAASLFNTGVRPDRIAGCIPICKCIDATTLLFADGTRIIKGVPAPLGAGSTVELGPLADVSAWERLTNNASLPHNPPTTVRQALNNTDYLLDDALDEIEAARNSANYGAQATLDARLEAPEVELVAARTSTVFGSGAYGSLTARIDAVDTHAGFVTTVGTGGQYTGASGLQDAIEDVITGGVGGCILVRKGTYTIDTALTITVPLSIIAVEEDVEVSCTQGSGYALTFDAATADASYVKGVTFTGTEEALDLNTPTHLKDCSFAIGIRITGPRCCVENCYFTLTTNLEYAVALDTLSWGVHLNKCVFIHTGPTYAALHIVSSGLYTVENCQFNLGEGAQAINCAATSVTGSFKNITISCIPSADSTTAVVAITTGSCVIENMTITHSSAATVKQPVFKAASTSPVIVRGLHIDLNESVVLYDAADKCPVLLLNNVTVYDFHFKNMTVPKSNTEAERLSQNYPVIRIAGSTETQPAILDGGRISQIYYSDTEEAGTDAELTLVGGSLADTAPFVLTHLAFDLTDMAAPTYDKYPSLLLRVVNNVKSGSVISDNTFVLGYVTQCIRIRGASGALVQCICARNHCVCTVPIRSVVEMAYVWKALCVDNVIESVLATPGDIPGGQAGISIDTANWCTINNNHISVLNNEVAIFYGIVLDDTLYSTCLGNVVYKYNSTVNAIGYSGSSIGTIPAEGDVGTLNALS